MKLVDLLGWASSVVLLITLARQVYTQWKSDSVAGVSKWLFVGQLAASTGFTAYSWLLHNWGKRFIYATAMHADRRIPCARLFDVRCLTPARSLAGGRRSRRTGCSR
jgi:uncharacterized protein with PQ loop repeat